MSFGRTVTLYDLRSYIDDYNCKIARVAKETGLTLAPFKFREGVYENNRLISGEIGFYNRWEIGEIEDPETAKYGFYKCDSTNCKEFAEELTELMDGFMYAYEHRQALLADFQKVWNNAKLPDHSSINVHYGLYSARILILLETMERFQIHLRRDTPFTGYTSNVVNGWLILRFNWHEAILTAFDDTVFLLEYKIDEYRKNQEAKRDLEAYHEKYQIFRHWEQEAITA